MNKKNNALIFLGLMMFAGSGFVFADNRPGAVTLRLADGYVFFADKRQLDNTSIPTIELGYNFNEKWGVQAGVSVINTDIAHPDPGMKPGAHGFYYLLDGVYHFNAHGHFQPYALGGVGITGLKVSNTNDPRDEANVNLGIGAEYFISESITLGVDARDVYTMSGGKNDVMLLAGVKFLFGGGYPEPEKAVTYKG